MNFVKVITALTGALPIITSVIGVVENLLGPKRGGEKKAVATSLAKTLLSTTEYFKGDDILDDALYAEGVELVIEGMVKIANSRIKR